MTELEFFKRTCEPEKLVRAVIDQLGGWEEFTESAKDITAHGIDGGFTGFIYHKDTVAFYSRNKETIKDCLLNLCEEIDACPVSFVTAFKCLNGDMPKSKVAKFLIKERLREEQIFADDDYICIANAMAWFAGEIVCHDYCYEVEND